jgi:signal transduction histidine kinase
MSVEGWHRMKPRASEFPQGEAESSTRRRQGVTASAQLLSEAERERLRSALHGGLGQLLTSISFLACALRQKLDERQLPEALEAAEILSLTGRAISETRALVQESPVTPPRSHVE